MKIGSNYLGNGCCTFTLWAPFLREVAVQIVSPQKRLIPMEPQGKGYWKAKSQDIYPGTLYFYQLNGDILRPDPASESQPHGVHQASEVINHSKMNWNDAGWLGVPLESMIIYELHVGTFTPEGTFAAIIPRLSELYELGVNAIEIMPVAQFPGDRNWGYDGVYPYAVQTSYGGPEGFKQLIDAAHQQGIAIILDVVYNHFGPEGNYTSEYAPYFTETYNTPWGSAINYDDAHSDGVRNYFIENALHWLQNYHIDALRLDAIHAIYDLGAKHILQEMAEEFAAVGNYLGRQVYLIAESDLNDVRVIRNSQQGGYGIDAQWSDDFHHCIHALLTKEQRGYYRDFGTSEQLVKAYQESFVYSWQYSFFRQRNHGSDASHDSGDKFVVCLQNHDQIGNRVLGERLSNLVSFAALKLAAGALLLTPNIPLIFMGEEYGEESPFLYFVNHTDPDLVEAVRKGRKKEFAAFHLEGEYLDPQNPDTLLKSKLHWEKRQEGKHKVLRKFYQQLIKLRRTIPALKNLSKQNLNAYCLEQDKLIFLHRWSDHSQVFCLMNFNDQDVSFTATLPEENWQKILDSADAKWMGSGVTLPANILSQQVLTINAHSLAVYQTGITI
ncbi:malto-oligosyltrehalose trehalohydrolase [Lyngbya aestuarii]|uniref:malto-oligosyltrehalose trehalohydrolase n=1 Tax=Lyngbya aestuarii TaxID=118322 RepID=UPI00403D709A